MKRGSHRADRDPVDRGVASLARECNVIFSFH